MKPNFSKPLFAVFLLILLAACQNEEFSSISLFIPPACIDEAENYLKQPYFYLEKAEVSYLVKDVESLPLHLYGGKIIEISWLKSHDIKKSIVANFNSTFSVCDANDGNISFDLEQGDLNLITEVLATREPYENLIIYINGTAVEAYYSDGRPKQLNETNP